MPSNRPRTLIIAPTYNERGNVEKFIYAVLSAMPWADILVIDDNSPDGTGSLADTFAMLLRQVRVLHRETKEGASTAYIQGFEYAIAHGYDLVCELDTNSAYDPGGLPLLVELALDGDLVIGSSYMRNSQLPDWTPAHWLINGTGNLVARAVLGLPGSDCTSYIRCYRTKALATLHLDRVTTMDTSVPDRDGICSVAERLPGT